MKTATCFLIVLFFRTPPSGVGPRGVLVVRDNWNRLRMTFVDDPRESEVFDSSLDSTGGFEGFRLTADPSSDLFCRLTAVL